MRCAAPDAQRDARVVVGAALGEQLAVPGPALGGGEAAAGVDRRELGELRAGRSPRCARRPRAARAGCARRRARRSASRPSSMHRARHGEAQRGERARRRARPRRSASTSCSSDRVAHRARHRADRVERGRQRHGAVGRRQPRRVLEADDALQRGRDADRAAGVGAERRPGRAGGDRHGAAGGRAARDARRRHRARAVAGLAGVPWCGLMPTPENANSVMLVRPMQRGAGRAQAGDGGASCAAGGRVGERRVEPARGRLAGDVEQVLDRDRQAGERAAVAPAAAPIGGRGGGARLRRSGREEGVCAGRRSRPRRSTASIAARPRRRAPARTASRASVRSAGIAACYNLRALPGADELPDASHPARLRPAVQTTSRTGPFKVSRRDAIRRAAAAIRAGF